MTGCNPESFDVESNIYANCRTTAFHQSLNRCLLIILADDPTVIKCAYIDTFSAVTIMKEDFFSLDSSQQSILFPVSRIGCHSQPIEHFYSILLLAMPTCDIFNGVVEIKK